MKSYTVEEVQKHNTTQDCWVIIDGKVFDVTQFLTEHPGGKKVLLKKGGKDASKEFKTFHNASIMQRLGLPMQVGVIGAAEPAKEEAVKPADVPAQQQQPISSSPVGELITHTQALFGEQYPYGDPSWYQNFNSPYYNESHLKVRKAMREWVDKEVTPFCHEWSENKEIPRSVLKRAAEVGFLAAVSGACTNPKMSHLLPYGLPGGVTSAEFDIFHEFICIDELARCGSGGMIWAMEGGLAIVSTHALS